MNTAQLVLTKNAQTQQREDLAPWFIGAAVVVFAIWVIAYALKSE